MNQDTVIMYLASLDIFAGALQSLHPRLPILTLCRITIKPLTEIGSANYGHTVV